MANTDLGDVGDLSVRDHNGMIELIPNHDDYVMLTPNQVAELITKLVAWLTVPAQENFKETRE